MAKQEGFHIADHGLFPILEFKLVDKSISAEELVRAAEKMHLELLKHGVIVQIQSKEKQEAA